MQGYYYTFSSLLAMSVFLELGFNGCIVQFISHEYAHLGMVDGKLNQGSTHALGRLASLTRLSLKWYSAAALLLFIGVGLAGVLFFRQHAGNSSVVWVGPWWSLCALSALNLLILPLSALIEGCDQVDWAARVRLLQNLGRTILLIGGLLMGFGLYAPALGTLCALLIYALCFSRKWHTLLRQVLTCPIEEKVSWAKEILPMQWRIALSWVSGYFIFSLFNPLLFANAGPEVAGQFGMTWAILSAISALCQSFVNTRAPKFAALIARKEWGQLRRLWKTALLQAIGLNVFGGLCFIASVQVLAYMNHPLRNRLSGIATIVLFSVAGLINQFVFTVATVARAEKKEPFLAISIIGAVITATGSYFTVGRYQDHGLAWSYLASSLVALVGSWLVLKKTALMRAE